MSERPVFDAEADGENIDHFFSKNPYNVLGVSSTASLDEIKRVRNELLKKFFPDVSTHPRRLEITQNINDAYEKIKDSRKEPVPEPPRPETKKGPTKESLEEVFISSLSAPSNFKNWLSRTESVGIGPDRVRELLGGPQAQEVLKRGFISRIKVLGENSSDDCLGYVEEWRNLGVELKDYFNLPEVRDLLTNRAIEIKIKIWGKDSPDKFIEFVESWKKAGIDLSKVVELPEAIRFLTNHALKIKIEVWGTDSSDKFIEFVESWKKAGVDLGKVVELPEAIRFLKHQAVEFKLKIWGQDNSDKFLQFVESWKKAGVDLGKVIELPEVTKFLKHQALEFKLKIYGRRKFIEFVESWKKAGWKPDEEIVRLLNE